MCLECNNISATVAFINNRNVFLTILEFGESDLTGSVSGESSLPGS